MLDYAAYIAGLPKVLAAAEVLFRDADGRVLLVRTTYREDGRWALPGGGVESDTGESPRRAARREVREELGIGTGPGALLAVDWVHGEQRPPVVVHLYDGGVLDGARQAAIVLQEEELAEWRTVAPDGPEAEALAAPGVLRRVRAALAARAAGGGPVELEDGLPADG
ncbi:NUDIX hydrolase [Streptomyces thermolineatus]|uniref:NUDIX hydrolase n=1 Tax=Streptomyces thermolineatus TaxID=44033 RepID=A0ABN3LVM0_9ACTN